MEQKEQKPFGLLLKNVIGCSHEDVLIDDQIITYDQNLLVHEGSLLTGMSQMEAKTIAGNSKPLHNYKFVSGHLTITLYCKPSQVFRLTKNQRALLNGVPRESDRVEVLRNLQWVEKLQFGSYVYVTIPTIPTPVRGIVYHIGTLDGEAGIKFGIELQESRGEGTSDGSFRDTDYFECEPNCAVFVSMDKLTQKEAVEAAKIAPIKRQSSQQQDDKPFKLGNEVKVFDKDGHPVKGVVRSVKKNILGIEAEKRLKLADIPGQVEDSKKRNDFTIVQHHHTKLFLPANLVEPYHSHEEPTTCSKHAANEKKSSQQRKSSGKPGTNVDSQMDIDTEALKEFEKAGINPGTVAVTYQMIALKQYEEKRKQKLAQPKKNKEMIEHQKRVQEAKDELRMEDWSSLDVSLLDIEKQKQILEEAKKVQEQEERRIHEEKRIQQVAYHERVEEVTQQQKEEAAQQKRLQEGNAEQQREEAARQKRLQGESILRQEDQECKEAAKQKWLQENAERKETARKERLQEAAQEEKLILPQQNKETCKTYTANKYNDTDSQSEEYYDTSEALSETLPNKQKSSPADVACIAGNITFGDSFNPDHIANHPQHNVITPVIITQPYSNQGHKPMWSPDLKPSRLDPKSSSDNSHNLEVGSLIQFGNPPCYGVIKWMGILPETEHVLMAGVEVEGPIEGYAKYDDGWYGGKRLFESQINRGLFLPLKGLHPDGRFGGGSDVIELPNPIKEQEYNPKGSYVKPPSELKQCIGKQKGIQGHQNSCYLDATLYGMFAFSDAFDGLFLDDVTLPSTVNNKAREIQEIIRENIVYRLRLNGVVTYNHVMTLREKLDKMLMAKGLVAEEKDPEEFLNLLFKHVLTVDAFLKLRRPSGADSEFFVQLFVEADKGMIMPTTQDLLLKMFKEQNITFAEYPSRLLVQVPRYGKHFKSFTGIIPSLELDISEICDGATSAFHQCYVCGKGGKWICSHCNGKFFCNQCKQLWHKHPGRENHHPAINQENGAVEVGKLQLLSVLCIETSHYVCFTRIMGSEQTDWVFFDSMAERPDDQHNLPCVKRCTHDIAMSVYNNKNIALEPLKSLPTLSRRFVQDTYLCIYIDPDGVMYQ